LLCALSLSLAHAHAFAQAEDPEAVYKQGIELRKQSKDEEALAKFKKAWELGKSPKARAQMALAEQALGRWADAESHLLEALAQKDDPWIVKQKKTLDDSLAEIGKPLGSLEVVCAVEGAEVFLNGTKIGVTPMKKPARVEAGTWTLEVKKADYYPVSKSVTVSPNGTAHAEIEMKLFKVDPTPVEPPPPAPPVATAAPPPPVQPPPSQVVAPPPVPETPPSTTQRTLGYVSLGVGAAFLVVGAASIVERNSKARSYNDDASCPGTGSGANAGACQDKIDSTHTWQTIGIVGFVGAGVLVGTGITLIATSPSPKTTTSTALACGTGPGTVGMSCRMTF
jgi:hypothetical protein